MVVGSGNCRHYLSMPDLVVVLVSVILSRTKTQAIQKRQIIYMRNKAHYSFIYINIKYYQTCMNKLKLATIRYVNFVIHSFLYQIIEIYFFSTCTYMNLYTFIPIYTYVYIDILYIININIDKALQTKFAYGCVCIKMFLCRRENIFWYLHNCK